MGQLTGNGWVLSGHSKGGNETQLVSMVFADRIRAAYSFDGQSFPKETLNDLYKIESNNDPLDMLLGINSDNDYVNGLAPRLTEPNKTLFLQTAELGSGDILTNHYILSMLDNGNIVDRGVPGPVSKTISRLSKDLLDIEDPNLREGAAFAVMSLLQAFLAKKPPEDGLSGVGHAGLNILSAIPSLISLKLTGKLDINSSVLDYLNQDHLIDYMLIGEPGPDAEETFLGDHDFETQEDIENYLSEHTENSKLEYLVRGALLRCRYGSHARRLNLPKCHGVYITTHPVIHEANCVAGLGPQLDNIPFFGVCKAPIPPVVEEVAYTKDRPRDQYGCPCGEPPAGIEKGWKCQPEIIRLWRDTYPKTRIVDNGLIDPSDRKYAAQGDELPVGRSSVTTLSFLVCRYGGLIEPYNSGQEYISDEEEMAYAEENEIPTVVEEGGMAVVGSEDAPGFETPISYEPRTINGKMLSEEVGYMIDSMVQYDIDGETIHYNWHNIGQYLSGNPSNMTPEKYDALSYVFGTMKSSDNIQKFINMGYWSADISQIEKPKPNAGSVLTPMDSYDYFNRSSQQQAIGSNYVYSAPNDILSGVMQWYSTAKEQGTLEDQYTLHSDILKSLSENGVGIFTPRSCSDEPITIDRHGFDYIVRIPPKEPYKADNQIEIEGNTMPSTDINPHE